MHGGELAVAKEAIDSPLWCVQALPSVGIATTRELASFRQFVVHERVHPCFDGRSTKVTLNNWLRSAKPSNDLCTDQLRCRHIILPFPSSWSRLSNACLAFVGLPQVRAFGLAFRAALTRVVLPAHLGHSADAR